MTDEMNPQQLCEEETTSEGVGAGQEAQMDAAQALELLIAERDAYLEMVKREKADFINYKRRTETLRKDTEEETRRDTIRAFLPVLDNLERALLAASDDSPLKDGVDMVLRQLQGALREMKVEVIDPQGEAFDAQTMEAVMQGTEDEGEPGTVCLVMQKGYRIGERVIRHAMVKVVAG